MKNPEPQTGLVWLMAGLLLGVLGACSSGQVSQPPGEEPLDGSSDGNSDGGGDPGLDGGGDFGVDAGGDDGGDDGGVAGDDDGDDGEIDGGSDSAWQALGLSGGGGLQVPSISPHDPGLILVTSDMGGVYRTTDAGLTWEMLHWSELSATTICPALFHPSRADTIYAVDDSFYRSLLKVSRDRGASWSQLVTPQPWGDDIQIHALAGDPGGGDRILVGLADGCWGSDDGGGSWWECTGISGVVVGLHVDQNSPVGQRVCYAGTSEGLYRSDDGCRSWQPKNSGLDLSQLERIDGVPGLLSSRTAFRYLSFAGASNAASGSTVLYVALPSRLDGQTLVGGIYRSTDGAQSWQPAMGAGINIDTELADAWGNGPVAQYAWLYTSNVDPQTVLVTNTSTGYNPPHHTTVYRSDDSGDAWRAVFFSDPRFAAFNVEHDYRSIADNANDQDPARGLAMNPADPDMLAFTNDAQFFLTTDAGVSWQGRHTRQASGQGPVAPGQGWECTGLVNTTTWAYSIDPFEPQRHYISYTDLGFARSLDGGDTWIHGAPGAPWDNNQYALVFDPQVPGRLWGAFARDHDRPMRRDHLTPSGNPGAAGVALSTDFGATWVDTSSGLPGTGAVTALAIDPQSPQGNRNIYAASFGHGVYKSTDDGQSWTAKNLGLGFGASVLNVHHLQLHPDGTLFVSIAGLYQGSFQSAGEGGAALYRSVDGAEHWECITPDTQARWITDFDLDPTDSDLIFYAARNGGAENGGVYRSQDGGQSWFLVLREGPEHFGVRLDPHRPGWVYASLAEDNPSWVLWLSQDHGDTWRAVESLPFQKPLRVVFPATDDGLFYVTSFGGGIWRASVDGLD